MEFTCWVIVNTKSTIQGIIDDEALILVNKLGKMMPQLHKSIDWDQARKEQGIWPGGEKRTGGSRLQDSRAKFEGQKSVLKGS